MLEEVSGTGMLWPLLIIFFTQVPFFNFCKKMQKMKIDYVHCPMRWFWRTSLRPVGQNNVGISKNWDAWGRLHLFAHGKTWVKFCLPTLHFLMGRTKGKNGSFIAIRMRIHQNFSSSMTPLWKKNWGRRLCPNSWLLCDVFALLQYCGALIGCPDVS